VSWKPSGAREQEALSYKLGVEEDFEMSGDVEIIRTREVRGPGARKARLKRVQENTREEKPEIAQALSAANNGAEEVHKPQGLTDSDPNSFVTSKQREVMVKVLRCCANPRLVLCAYQDDGLERRVLVRVGRNRNFVRGMELKAIRPPRESEVWGYPGRLPRLRGRW
jgi:hypothetical protein